MAKTTLHIADQEVVFAPDLFIVPAAVMLDKQLQPLDSKVYACVYWMERLKDGRCYASNATIAKVVAGSPSGVANALVRLREAGYIHCQYDDKDQRTGIVTLIQMRKTPYSNEEGGVTQISNKGNKNKEKYTETEMKNIRKVYVTWLKRFVLTTDQRSITDPDLRSSTLKAAANRCRLTDQRKVKINARVRSLGLEPVIRAVYAIGESEWHRGDNDNNWTASLEWLMKSDEKVEEWANKMGDKS